MSVLTVFIYKLQQNNLNRPQHLSGDRHLLHKQAQLCEVSNSGKEKKTHTHTHFFGFISRVYFAHLFGQKNP